MIPVLVMVSDKYLSTLRPFAHLFQKYWGWMQNVTVVCFKEPDFKLPMNFAVHSMGDMANYPVTKWSDSILDYLDAHPHIDRFILLLEDYWLTRPVDLQAITMLSDYSRQFENVLKIDLCADRLYAGGMTDYNNCGRLDLVKSDHASQYHMSLMAGIWNTELFKKVVIRGETPWQVELEGTSRLATFKDEILVLGTRQWPVRYILANRNGDPTKLHLDGLGQHDITELKTLGLL